MHRRLVVLGSAFLVLSSLPVAATDAQTWRNGMRFDSGTEMTERAPGAPKALDRVAGYLGQYDVEMTVFRAEQEPLVVAGRSEITWINRGHALMESFFSPEVEGHRLASIFVLGFNPASGRWYLGGADSWSESAWLADGDFADSRLELTDTRRRNGGIGRTEIRHSFALADGVLTLAVEESSDGGATWAPSEKRVYRRRPPTEDFLAPASRYGSPHPDRPAAAAAFDFMIGEWNESHQLTRPDGQTLRWPANGTAVHALDGTAILEFSWFDVDPSLADAATTILRIYNRALDRWECLYFANRGHSALYFGGRQVGSEVVLGNFETDAAAPALSRYVFHDASEDAYSWYSESSRDRGATWTRTWVIGATRKPDGD